MIKIERINRAEALRYMGYNKDIDLTNIEGLLDSCEKELLSVIKPRYCCRIFDIEIKDSVELKDCRFRLTGKDITEHLKDCNKAIIFAATLSADADRLINRYKVKDMTSALILDCMASAAIEQYCDMAEKEIGNDRNMTWRFSPGYGDLPIGLQREFISSINAEKLIGLTVTDSNILIPRKSVTAVIGLSDREIPKGRRGCAICSMAESCQYRKRGEHCGL